MRGGGSPATCALPCRRVARMSASRVERRSTAGQPLDGRAEIRDIAGRASLLYELVHRDLTIRYKRSFFGFFWTMLHPLLLMLIFVAVFSHLFDARTPNYAVYFLSAYVAWNFVAQTLVNAMAAVAWNGPLMKRVRVPPSIFTVASTLSGVVNLGLSLLMLLAIMLITGAPLQPALAFLPVSLLIVGVFALGAALALTAVSIYFGDVREMVQAGLPALMYLTPIIYPVEIVPERYRWLIDLNPMTYLVEIVRAPIHRGEVPSAATLLIAASLAIAALATGWAVFRRMAPRFHAYL